LNAALARLVDLKAALLAEARAHGPDPNTPPRVRENVRTALPEYRLCVKT
jgi:hypothetical protein